MNTMVVANTYMRWPIGSMHAWLSFPLPSPRDHGSREGTTLFLAPVCFSDKRLVTLTRPNRLITPVIYCTSRGTTTSILLSTSASIFLSMAIGEWPRPPQLQRAKRDTWRIVGYSRNKTRVCYVKNILHYCALRLWVDILSPLRLDLSSSLSTASHEAPELNCMCLCTSLHGGKKRKARCGVSNKNSAHLFGYSCTYFLINEMSVRFMRSVKPFVCRVVCGCHSYSRA